MPLLRKQFRNVEMYGYFVILNCTDADEQGMSII